MSVKTCKRILVTINKPGAYVRIWQPAFPPASSMETIVQSGLSSKTFMTDTPTYIQTPFDADDLAVTNGPLFAAGETLIAGDMVGWRLLVDGVAAAGFSTADPLTVG